MSTISNLVASNQSRWSKMTVRQNLVAALDDVARQLLASKARTRYESVSNSTGVPWFIIAVIHEREASQSWKANLAQGDPWNKPSIHVPKGRGPFNNWEEAAIDALSACPPHAANWKDWTAGGALTLLEQYNGLGYAAKGVPSPYIWASTDQYVKGKYVADGHYDPNVIDKQLGCAALIARMMAKDPSIKL